MTPTGGQQGQFALGPQCKGTHNYIMWLLRSPLARALYVALFDLKPLIEGGNLQVYMTVHAPKRASGAPRTQFRACKISWGRAPRPFSHNPFCGTPLFVFALGPPQPSQQSYWWRQICTIIKTDQFLVVNMS